MEVAQKEGRMGERAGEGATQGREGRGDHCGGSLAWIDLSGLVPMMLLPEVRPVRRDQSLGGDDGVDVHVGLMAAG